jgi:hypothetical protein
MADYARPEVLVDTRWVADHERWPEEMDGRGAARLNWIWQTCGSMLHPEGARPSREGASDLGGFGSPYRPATIVRDARGTPHHGKR